MHAAEGGDAHAVGHRAEGYARVDADFRWLAVAEDDVDFGPRVFQGIAACAGHGVGRGCELGLAVRGIEVPTFGGGAGALGHAAADFAFNGCGATGVVVVEEGEGVGGVVRRSSRIDDGACKREA